MIASAFASALAGIIANLAGFAGGLGASTVAQSVAWVLLAFSGLAAAAIPVSILAVRRSASLRFADRVS
jgi:hypothetical protein